MPKACLPFVQEMTGTAPLLQGLLKTIVDVCNAQPQLVILHDAILSVCGTREGLLALLSAIRSVVNEGKHVEWLLLLLDAMKVSWAGEASCLQLPACLLPVCLHLRGTQSDALAVLAGAAGLAAPSGQHADQRH